MHFYRVRFIGERQRVWQDGSQGRLFAPATASVTIGSHSPSCNYTPDILSVAAH
jgi:hypothetical protein